MENPTWMKMYSLLEKVDFLFPWLVCWRVPSRKGSKNSSGHPSGNFSTHRPSSRNLRASGASIKIEAPTWWIFFCGTKLSFLKRDVVRDLYIYIYKDPYWLLFVTFFCFCWFSYFFPAGFCWDGLNDNQLFEVPGVVCRRSCQWLISEWIAAWGDRFVEGCENVDFGGGRVT